MDLALMVFCWTNWSGNSSGTWSRPFTGLLSVGGAPLPTQLKLLDAIGPVAVATGVHGLSGVALGLDGLSYCSDWPWLHHGPQCNSTGVS